MDALSLYWAEFSRPDKIAACALLVAIIALIVAGFAAKYARAQARAATRSDIRTELAEINAAQALVTGLPSALQHDVGVARASKSAFFLRGAGPAMERAPKAYPGQTSRMAEAALRTGEFASVPLSTADRLLWQEIVNKEEVLIRDLNYIWDGMANGSAIAQTGRMDQAAEILIGDYEAFLPRLRDMKARILGVLEARAKVLRGRLR